MKKRNDMYVSYLTCPECGRKFPIARKGGEKRERGHVKDLWCPWCGDVKKFRENEVIV